MMTIRRVSLLLLFLALVGCPSEPGTNARAPTTPSDPVAGAREAAPSTTKAPPKPMEWCEFVRSVITLPSNVACQDPPGYFGVGFVGPKSNPIENDFDYFLPTPRPQGFEPHIEYGLSSIGRRYEVDTTTDAEGGLQLSFLPASFARWLPDVKVRTSSTTGIHMRVSLANVTYTREQSTMFAARDAITSGIAGNEGSPGCQKLLDLFGLLCTPGNQTSQGIIVAQPIIDLSTNDGSELDADAGLASLAKVAFTKKHTARDHVTLTADVPLGIGVLWTTYDASNICKGAVPTCPKPPPPLPPQPPPPSPARCNSTKISLPDARGYRVTQTSFDGGGAFRTTLVQSSGGRDAQVDTLPFNGGTDRTVSGPAEIFVCSQNYSGGAAGCSFQCTGVAPNFHMTYPMGDGVRDRHADFTVSPLP